MKAGERLLGSKWFKDQVDKEAAKDAVTSPERIAQLLSFFIGVILIAFFAIHETRPTGFFTDDFEKGDAALLYALIVLGMVSPLIRFVFSRKNIARPIDAVGMAYVFVVGLYFLISFPFDFSHFAEPLPRALEPVLDWVSGTLARWLLGFCVILSPFFSVYTFLLYIGVRRRLSEKPTESKSVDSVKGS